MRCPESDFAHGLNLGQDQHLRVHTSISHSDYDRRYCCDLSTGAFQDAHRHDNEAHDNVPQKTRRAMIESQQVKGEVTQLPSEFVDRLRKPFAQFFRIEAAGGAVPLLFSFVIMPLFAFANAGLPLSIGDLATSVTVAVFVGFVLGKPIGVLTFSSLVVRFGLATRPKDLSWRAIAGGGLLAGIGFTMALFIADLAFDENLLNSAKLGIFAASIVSAMAGVGVLMFAPTGEANLPLATSVQSPAQTDEALSKDRWSDDGGQN